MRTVTLVPLAALALTACQSQPTVALTNASPEEVVKQASAAGATTMFNPGKWESKIEMLDMKMPGMDQLPPGFADKIKARMQQAQITSRCLSPEEAHKPAADMFTGKTKQNCSFDHYTMAGGKIDATMTCHEKTGDMTMHMAGTFSSDSYTVESEMNADTSQGAMHSKTRVSGHRVGDCTASDSDK